MMHSGSESWSAPPDYICLVCTACRLMFRVMHQCRVDPCLLSPHNQIRVSASARQSLTHQGGCTQGSRKHMTLKTGCTNQTAGAHLFVKAFNQVLVRMLDVDSCASGIVDTPASVVNVSTHGTDSRHARRHQRHPVPHKGSKAVEEAEASLRVGEHLHPWIL